MSTEVLNIAGFECLCSLNQNANKTIVLLHGYGANMEDLFGLTKVLSQAGDFNFIYPNGKVRIPFGDFWEGRAWFEIDQKALEDSMRTGIPRDFKNNKPEGFEKILAEQELLLRELQQRFGQLILGGFSQGAMCSGHLFFRNPELMDGLILLSGVLLYEDGLKEYLPKEKLAHKVFQSHGREDLVLGFSQAKQLRSLMEDNVLNYTFSEFSGGHEIPVSVINDLVSFLKN